MKVREEIETTVQDESSLVTILERLGLRLCFHYQKYRQEFQHLGVVLAIDETPIGTFVELEGNKSGITTIATAMGQAQCNYILDSYRGLYLEKQGSGVAIPENMLFDD